jgi:aminoglycoside/choline kinase family phosphotransferase
MLKDIEVRRIISYLSKILEEQELAEIEDILRSEDGVEVIREPDFLQFFRTDFL